MSEFQYYEFQAIDRPLSKDEQAELRGCSSRARISASHFVNEYNWGDLKGNPMEWMERYFDAHLYLSNFGSRMLALRLPLTLVDLEMIKPYELDGVLETRTTASHLIISFLCEDDSGDYIDEDDASGQLASILPIRDSLARGDLRALYLGWLSGVRGYADEDTPEPPLPPGLASLDAGLEALADFLQVDIDLLSVAAQNSASLSSQNPSDQETKTWIATLPPEEKDAWLLRFLTDSHSSATMVFQRAFLKSVSPPTSSAPPVRDTHDLVTAAQQQTSERRAREKAAEEAKRRDYLITLAGNESSHWKSIIKLTESSSQNYYDSATRMLIDLRDLASLTGETESFLKNLDGLRELRRRKSSFMARLEKAGLT